MIAQFGPGDPGLRRLEQASLWLQRLRTESHDEQIVEAWLYWCHDPLNQQAFDEIAIIWQASGFARNNS